MTNAATIDAPANARTPAPRATDPAAQLNLEAAQRECLARYGLRP